MNTLMKGIAGACLAALTAAAAPSMASEDREKAPPGTTGGEKRAPAETKSPTVASTQEVPVYRPPLRGAPGGRVGGGTRGVEREVFVLSVLAPPDHTGLTAQEQVSLYWFISSRTSYPVEVTVVDPGATRPLLEARVPPPVAPGIHRLRLAEHGVRLAPEVRYRWFVAVVPDPDRRARDLLAGATIERVAPAGDLRGRLETAGPERSYFVYAEAGLWYDALAAVSELIEGAPKDPALRRQRAALLEQVGLQDAARHDREQAGP
jgi:hypothetical protein